MIVNPQNLRGIYVGFNTLFNKALTTVDPLYKQIATVTPSTTDAETYAWLGDIPGMREWIGDREIQNLAASGYVIKNRDFELTVGIDRNAIEDDKISLYNPSIEMLAQSAALEAYIAARAGMMSLTNTKGRALNIVPDTLVVPPALEAKARDILVADFINGTRNTMQGTAKPLVVPQLAGHDSAWFLLSTSRPLKPLIYQERKKAKFVSKTAETDDNVFMKKQFLYGADSRGNAGFGFWQMAYGSDGSAKA